LPPYSPELNPDELAWNYLKNQHTGRMSHGSKNEFHERVISIMQSLQQLKDKVRGFFRHPILKYTTGCSVIYALVNNEPVAKPVQ
jgi:transposase